MTNLKLFENYSVFKNELRILTHLNLKNSYAKCSSHK